MAASQVPQLTRGSGNLTRWQLTRQVFLKFSLRYSLTCSQLAPGDVCISLTHTPRSNTSPMTSREERRKGEEEEEDHRADFALMPPPAEGRTSRGVGGGGGGEDQAREAGAQRNLGTQRPLDFNVSQATSIPLKAIQAGGHAPGHLSNPGAGGQVVTPGGQDSQVSAPGRTKSGP